MAKIFPSALVGLIALSTTSLSSQVLASVILEGTCDGSNRCEVRLEGDKISTDSGINVNSDNIISWVFINDNNKGGVYFRARNEDYRIMIKYFDESGNKKLSKIGFFNFKSAQEFVGSMEIISGLATNHDQSGATTHCTASGKNSSSGSDKQVSSLSNRTDGVVNTAMGAGLGAAIGSITNATTGVVGAIGGAIGGAAIGNNSGEFSLQRNVVSEIRSEPANSKLNSDASFAHRKDCIDEPTVPTTKVSIKSSIPTIADTISPTITSFSSSTSDEGLLKSK